MQNKLLKCVELNEKINTMIESEPKINKYYYRYFRARMQFCRIYDSLLLDNVNLPIEVFESVMTYSDFDCSLTPVSVRDLDYALCLRRTYGYLNTKLKTHKSKKTALGFYKRVYEYVTRQYGEFSNSCLRNNIKINNKKLSPSEIKKEIMKYQEKYNAALDTNNKEEILKAIFTLYIELEKFAPFKFANRKTNRAFLEYLLQVNGFQGFTFLTDRMSPKMYYKHYNKFLENGDVEHYLNWILSIYKNDLEATLLEFEDELNS
ncbi:hypothetical protein [Mycoplasma seminis]|uniref:Fido domain-containing protein n=1 Tax=Mycoplasma seminis TaxID=512749 RepID=A0ABY9HB47_9MOLU|nr:hypothetical protein [Mycoplasma seminis]WLP85691.1 hypothetical protein Q8852_00840 [Mycoplasma seminis]